MTCIASLPGNLSLPVTYTYRWINTFNNYVWITQSSTFNINYVNVSNAGLYECGVIASVNSRYVSESVEIAFGYLTVTSM